MEVDDGYVEYVPVEERLPQMKRKVVEEPGKVKLTEEAKPSLLVQATQLKRHVP